MSNPIVARQHGRLSIVEGVMSYIASCMPQDCRAVCANNIELP